MKENTLPKIIALLNQKGGVGKTTLSTNLARFFQLEKHDVLLVDSDPQGSARDWAACTSEKLNYFPTIGIDRPTLDRDLTSIGKQFDIETIA